LGRKEEKRNFLIFRDYGKTGFRGEVKLSIGRAPSVSMGRERLNVDSR